jgi:hypothetical protein
MDDAYFLGATIALLIESLNVVIYISRLKSIKTQNLNQIGLFWDYFRNSYIIKRRSKLECVLGIFLSLIVATLFSWVYVFGKTYNLIYCRIIDQIKLPHEVELIKFKISMVNMNVEQVNQLAKRLDEIIGLDLPMELKYYRDTLFNLLN